MWDLNISHVSTVLQYLCHVPVDLVICVMSEWCYHAKNLGLQYLCHVMSESQWCHHVSFLGTQYICHGGLGVPVVLPC